MKANKVERVVRKQCLGYAEFEGNCKNNAGTRWTPHWCDRCDKIRRDTITKIRRYTS